MKKASVDTFQVRSSLKVGENNFDYFSLPELEKQGFKVNRLPFALKVLLENVLRNEDGLSCEKKDIEAICQWDSQATPSKEIPYTPARVLLQDFTGVPAVVDLAAMRDAMKEMGGDPEKINPLLPAELVIDHSVQVDFFGTKDSPKLNAEKEFVRNRERYEFLKWGQSSIKNFKAVPPDIGIVHQVNIEYLARVVFGEKDEKGPIAYPDTLVGTDSHTTMVNGLGVLGWGVGGIEAEAAMLGQAIPLLVPQVIGFKLTGKLAEGMTTTDLVLTITEQLRAKGVVGKFVEFFGDGIADLTLAERSTIANMAPEFGSTCGIFPIDKVTVDYLKFTGRDEASADLVEAYAKAQGMYFEVGQEPADYSDVVELDMSTVVPTISGPKRPQDKIFLTDAEKDFAKVLPDLAGGEENVNKPLTSFRVEDPTKNMELVDSEISNGSIVIAAITSCTNTSNPSVLIAAGLVAKKAVEKGLERKSWVKTSLAPGSQVVTAYLTEAGLQEPLDKIGFNVVGYGCTTCIGNSGPLQEPVAEAIQGGDYVVCSVLSGNRNFEGRINPHVKANYLMSPPLVVAYALIGRMDVDITTTSLGQDKEGNDVFLKDIWPSQDEVQTVVNSSVTSKQYKEKYADVFKGDESWAALKFPTGDQFQWGDDSTYIRRPSFLMNIPAEPAPLSDIKDARVLAKLGDSVTTDHISPAGSIAADSPAAKYLEENNIDKKDFNSYGSRRGNHEVMVRGTFANIRLRNELAPGTEGGWTCHQPDDKQMSIYDASKIYLNDNISLIVLAGKEYGTGSSRDWAAKGTHMLGVKAVIAESYERIHRSNLIGMGVLPLEFKEGDGRESLSLSGKETFEITGIADGLAPGELVKVKAVAEDGAEKSFEAVVRIDTPMELEYYKHGGILLYVLRMLKNN
ncbi:MAG: aconitate hydratase AcnA [Planctomycetota bacterium]|nr:MAG: aconitate hydratase AcnA [Planctomycetota bacterium]